MNTNPWVFIVVGSLAAFHGKAAAVNCQFNLTPLSFNAVNALDAVAIDSMSTITITCAGKRGDTAEWTLSLHLAQGSVAGQLHSGRGGSGLHFQLYVDAARTIPWGNGLGGSSPMSGQLLIGPNGTAVAQAVCYARLFPVPRHTPAGTYTESAVATLSYR